MASNSILLQIAAAEIERVFPAVLASQYLTLSGYVLILYDYLLTFDAEVEFIWKARNKSTISIIFLTNRYLVPLILTVDIYDRLGLAKHPSVEFCKVWVVFEAYLMIFSFMSLHGLVAMRVHALYGGPRWLKWLLWVSGVSYALVTIILLAFALRHNNLAPAPYFNSCFANLAPYLWAVWVPALSFELLLFVLTILKAFNEARHRIYSPISSVLYRDGMLYFVAISACSMFTMMVWLVGEPAMIGLAKYWSFAVANVTAGRLVLNLKMHARALRIARAKSDIDDEEGRGPVGKRNARGGYPRKQDRKWLSPRFKSSDPWSQDPRVDSGRRVRSATSSFGNLNMDPAVLNAAFRLDQEVQRPAETTSYPPKPTSALAKGLVSPHKLEAAPSSSGSEYSQASDCGCPYECDCSCECHDEWDREWGSDVNLNVSWNHRSSDSDENLDLDMEDMIEQYRYFNLGRFPRGPAVRTSASMNLEVGSVYPSRPVSHFDAL